MAYEGVLGPSPVSDGQRRASAYIPSASMIGASDEHCYPYEWNSAGLITRSIGRTVPTDGETGFAQGSQFIKIGGTTGSTLYVNEAEDNAACDFNAK